MNPSERVRRLQFSSFLEERASLFTLVNRKPAQFEYNGRIIYLNPSGSGVTVTCQGLQLTLSEIQVLYCRANGISGREITKKLGLTPSTIKNLLTDARERNERDVNDILTPPTTMELVVKAATKGFLDEEFLQFIRLNFLVRKAVLP